MNDPDMGTWYYSYDASGNLANQTDARGCLTSISYDLLNRPAGKSYSGSCGVTTSSVTYSYDNYSPFNGQFGRGYRTGMTDGSGFTGWMYDPRGRLRWESKNISGSGTFVTEWSYNSADLVEWMKYPGGNGGQQGEQVNFTYVPQMLVHTAIGATTYVKNATYDAAGRTDILELGLNGSTSYMYLDYGYYAWDVQGGRLQWLQAVQTSGAAQRQKLEYAYDAAGNVDWIKEYLAGSPYQLQDFTYDLLNRLDAASATGGDGQGLYHENYDYDSQGNLWKKGIPGSEKVYTYLDSSHKHAVTHLGGPQKYWYDANGNMTMHVAGAVSYTQGWDAENRLTSVSGTGMSSTFGYDGDGVRVKGTVNGTVTAYVSNWFEWSESAGTPVSITSVM
jgi:YD repeat-containing protein